MDFKGKRIFFNTIGAVLSFMLTISALFCVALFGFTFTHLRTEVSQLSMYPTINKNVKNNNEFGDTVFVNLFAELQRNDIVIAELFENEDPVCKRLVAMPNDTIRILDKGSEGFDLYVNEKFVYNMPEYIQVPNGNGGFTLGNSYEKYREFVELIDSCKKDENRKDRVVQNEQGLDMYKLKDDEYFLMGDNWSNSKDSMSNGIAASKDKIYGSVDLIAAKGSNKQKILFKEILKLLFCK